MQSNLYINDYLPTVETTGQTRPATTVHLPLASPHNPVYIDWEYPGDDSLWFLPILPLKSSPPPINRTGRPVRQFNMPSPASKPTTATSTSPATTSKKPHITEQPMTSANWYKHIDWLNVTFIIGVPLYGLIAAYWTPLCWKTALWAVAYYFMTGMGITAGMFLWSLTWQENR